MMPPIPRSGRKHLGTIGFRCDTLSRYHTFFQLCGNFDDYVDFVLFNDLVNQRDKSIRFFLPHADFQTSPYRHDLASYLAYTDAATTFIAAQNSRIAASVVQQM